MTDARVVGRLLGPIQDHYERLVDRGWPLLWRCLQRERTYPAARSVTRRWEHDLERLGRHLEWVVGKGGAYRTRQTHVQAAQRLADWERAAALLEAEEIVDDPLRAIPCLLRHEGFQGRVVKVNLENREAAGRRPLVDVETDDPCLMPGGKEVYWTATPAAAAWTVESISPSRRGGSTIRLKRTSRTDPGAEPQVGAMVTFTVYTTRPNGYRAPVPGTVPWTHERATPQESPSIEDGDGRPWE